MGGAPNDRDEKDDAPEPSRNPWVTWMVWLVLAPLLYVLSIGPMAFLANKHLTTEWLMNIYLPLMLLPEPLARPLDHYVQWWLP